MHTVTQRVLDCRPGLGGLVFKLRSCWTIISAISIANVNSHFILKKGIIVSKCFKQFKCIMKGRCCNLYTLDSRNSSKERSLFTCMGITKRGGVTRLFHGGINFLLNVLILQWLGRVKRLTKKIATVERLQINFKTSKICSIIFNLFLPIKYTEGGGVKIYLDNYYNTVIWMHPYLCNTYVWCLSVL